MKTVTKNQEALNERLPEPVGDGVLTVWLKEEGDDKKARQEMAAILKSEDIVFRKLRRIVRELFDKSIDKTYEIKDEREFELGYRLALRDIYKIIPTTRSE